LLTRRSFHRQLLALLAASALPLPRPAGAAAGGGGGDALLNRLSFGATETSRRELALAGPEDWLEGQLAAPPGDAGLTRRLAAARLRIAYEAGDDGAGGHWPATDEMRPLGLLEADPAGLLGLLDHETAMDYAERVRPAQEVIAASLLRAVHAEAQLREVMTQFWHDHFNVMSTASEATAVFFPAYDRMLRDHAFGNFRALLGEVAKAPAMLTYLGNADSRASPANENFARELLELHTLGAGNYQSDRIGHWSEVPGAALGLALGYIDEDVYEAARCFTGWTVGDGRWIGEGREAPMSGAFHYAEAWHDPYQKRFLGREFPSHQGPLADGEQALDMLATHPGTARFVCGKIARRLLADDPDPDLVEHLAGVFLREAGALDQIARVIRALVAHPAFAATPPGKLRRPFEVLAALYRATGAEVASAELGWNWQLSRAGWRQHAYPPPTGHPDLSADWANSTYLARVVDLALYAHDQWFDGARPSAGALVPDTLASFGQVCGHWTQRLHGRADETGYGPVLERFGVSEADPLPDDPEDREHAVAMALAVAALSPAFLYR
jgi:uncharacterized protein (DUF1800 family)